jgi:hypothetical protein
MKEYYYPGFEGQRVHLRSTDFDAMVERIRQDFPKFQIKFKDESPRMRFWGKICKLWNPRWMTSYITVTGQTVWVPNREWMDKRLISVLRCLPHEIVHMLDRRKWKILFDLSYATPWGRAHWERNGYTTDIVMWVIEDRVPNEDIQDHVEGQFTSSSYGWMWPFPAKVDAWVDEVIENPPVDEEPWATVLGMISDVIRAREQG